MKKNIFNICDVAYITRKTIISAFIVLLFAGIVGMAAAAETSNRAANIKSKGVFEYNDYQVVFDASDLTYLADEIDLLEDTYKTETVNALNDIGTYYMTDGTVTHNSNSDILAPENSSVLSFNAIKDGIEKSQSIPTDRTYSGMLPGTDEEITDNISAATAENLTLGTAAWVDGELIVGTGGDNNSYYNQGYAVGYLDGTNKTGNISYIYHYHDENSDCYESKNCTISYQVSAHTSSDYCSSCGGTQAFNYYSLTTSHSACGTATVADKYMGKQCKSCGRIDAGVITSSSQEVHTYKTYTCGYHNGEMIGATIHFD